ncbi:MAG: alanine racemase [Clostridiales bacterium]|nr:MAG: alanine racemase [Clostridiales bacterium]
MRLLAVIKADAYGHGAVEVAQSLLFDGGARLFRRCNLRRGGTAPQSGN